MPSFASCLCMVCPKKQRDILSYPLISPHSINWCLHQGISLAVAAVAADDCNRLAVVSLGLQFWFLVSWACLWVLLLLGACPSLHDLWACWSLTVVVWSPGISKTSIELNVLSRIQILSLSFHRQLLYRRGRTEYASDGIWSSIWYNSYLNSSLNTSQVTSRPLLSGSWTPGRAPAQALQRSTVNCQHLTVALTRNCQETYMEEIQKKT